MLRKLLLSLLFPALVAGAIGFAACGGDDDDDDPTATSEPTQVEPTGEPTGESDGGEEIDSEDIIPMYEKTAVFILAEGFYGGASSGTGIVLDAEGNILTNNHVVEGAGSLAVRDPETDQMIPARIVGRSPCDDLAVIQVRDPDNFVPAELGAVADLAPGSQVYAVGFPSSPSEDFFDTRLSITGGLVSKLDAQMAYYGLQNMIQTDTALNHGNSGGPLVDKFGRVVGVNTLGSAPDLQNTNYAISIDEARSVFEQLLEGRDIDWLGVNAEPNDPSFEIDFGVPYVENTLVIIGVDPNSPLFEESWIEGDVIAFADGKALATPGDLCSVIRSKRPGDEILLEGLGQFRNNQTQEITYDLYTTRITIP
ncbi:MAG TPA: S1C family serine protease [Dehalococcoidia bacterium]|nr:S1C family serine protease [Dehalococcoidia bacterium]